MIASKASLVSFNQLEGKNFRSQTRAAVILHYFLPMAFITAIEEMTTQNMDYVSLYKHVL